MTKAGQVFLIIDKRIQLELTADYPIDLSCDSVLVLLSSYFTFWSEYPTDLKWAYAYLAEAIGIKPTRPG